MSLSEFAALQCLRKYRSERADLLLQKARMAHRGLSERIKQAREVLVQTRLQEVLKRNELLSRYQGQFVLPRTLRSWGEDERKVSVETTRQEHYLHELLEQQRVSEERIELNRRHASLCMRQVEKLGELSVLLAQEQTCLDRQE